MSDPERTAASDPKVDVLIVGAGPTGLNLALRLANAGIRFRIIDQAAGPASASRAMIVHARTLELYRQIGLDADVTAAGIPIHAMHLRVNGEEKAVLPFGEIGRGLSPYPYLLSYPQDDHERLLAEKLKERGVEIEWRTTLRRLSQSAGSATAHVATADREELIGARYVCGCDGGHSTVRSELGISFEGGSYPVLFFVADVRLSETADADGAINLGSDLFLLKLPVRSTGMHRLIGLVPHDLTGRPDLSMDDLAPRAEHLIGVKIVDVNWFSTYHAHHRVAGRFRQGRCFLLGDAGHVHSPAGGQGMNTGIGDAVNLAWKLAAVVRERASADLLDSYEPERIAFARRLVATTDRVFRVPIASGWRGTAVREVLLPSLGPTLLSLDRFRRTLFRIVSQIDISYRRSPLSEGRAGDVRAGDRLPWVKEHDNFAALHGRDWQIHVYGEASAALCTAARERALWLQTYPCDDAAIRAGFIEDAAYLIRPDGYLGLILPDQDVTALQAYVEKHRLRFTGL